MTNLEEIKVIIQKYENKEAEFSDVTAIIKSLTGKDVSQNDLDNYWTYQDLESFCKGLIIESIENWKDIDDSMARNLIREILDNLIDDSIIARNSEALEKRYGKPQGTVVSMIFDEELTEEEIVIELKNNDIIQL
ncbi:hypothetical protein PQ462_22330 [Flavobacterium sp. KACC 22758]|uniref:hypothetical protein n=1 Tax=Flavobacterium sp. KACC 22758 TaxID=3025667 RepID=UPI0023652811|nr:hypothetical protein [Flavobacterium sp. KACC 22758]WDF59434.1 hypothetical protein PQ462_22330 [Flavobacterium sp. KACC 22758]